MLDIIKYLFHLWVRTPEETKDYLDSLCKETICVIDEEGNLWIEDV